MHSKAKIFNLALGHLLLSRQIIDADTDKSNEAIVLRTHYDVAFYSTLEELDLDSTSTQAELELIEEDPNDLWNFAYKYPTSCAFFRRIQSRVDIDDRSSHIPKRIAMLGSQKAIFTNEPTAIGEFISADINIASLSATAGLAVSYKLAMMASPLVVGKGAARLMEAIRTMYVMTKAEAQKQDRDENFNFTDEATLSEFVRARTT